MNITKKNNLIEIIVFSLFCILTITLSFFHEPWFDELQAWGISKASIYDILFVIPHFEGHPPLWYLLLKPLSALNIFPDTGLKIVNFAFMLTAVWLLIFKSKLPSPVKFLLPFTYFIFYQYSIISRPYCIYCLAMFLIACFYNTKNEHPYRFTSFLALLSLSCTFGMAVACGISIVWIIELFKAKTPLKNKAFISLFILFIFACIMAALIIPDKHNYLYYNSYVKDSIVRCIYSFLILPADALIYDFYNYDNNSFQFIDFNYYIRPTSNGTLALIQIMFYIGCFLGVILNIFLFCFFKKTKNLLLFIIPYILFIISGLYYISPHHVGLLTVLLISLFWIVYSQNNINLNGEFKKLLVLFTVLTIGIQIYWSIFAAIHEIKYDYYPTKALYNYIKQNNLDKYKLMSDWLEQGPFIVNKKTHKVYIGEYNYQLRFNGNKNVIHNLSSNDYEILQRIEPEIQWHSACINLYFNKNIFFNGINKPYITHKYVTPDEKLKIFNNWRKFGLPDIIVGGSNIDDVYTDKISPSKNYILLKKFNFKYIFKNSYSSNYSEIYINKDLKL